MNLEHSKSPVLLGQAAFGLTHSSKYVRKYIDLLYFPWDGKHLSKDTNIASVLI